MIPHFLRTSPLLAAVYSRLHGTRFRVSGRGHRIERSTAVLRDTSVEVGGEECRLVLEAGARFWNCSIRIVGRGAELHVGAGCQLLHTQLLIEDDGSRIHIGADTGMIGATLVSQEGRLLQIGRDCMIAKNVELRNSDSHSILGSDGSRINSAADVIVGDHVWIGLGACVLKGARINDGAIIGARAFVTREIPANCIATGTPARSIRRDISWDRRR